MKPLFENKAACFGCSACRSVCPEQAITLVKDEEGFLYPVIREERCTDCGICHNTCPINKPLAGTVGQPYAVRCNDLELLKNSSSGGAFSLMADQVLKNGGLVCGAAFDETFHVHHVLSDDISPMRKSKYVQSDLENVFQEIADVLQTGREVLFTGTPCQCDGLLHYVGEKPKNLILAALICRGVQSPGLWEEYVAHIAADGQLEAYCFRDKRIKNDGHTVSFTVNGSETAVSMGNDPFSRLYMKCITLRPSCYHCPYTRWDLPFDLTIGDFWGIEKFNPSLADGMGTSLAIVRTKQGMQLLEKIRPYALILESTKEVADQIALNEPARETILHKLLYRDYARKNENGSNTIPLILKKYGG